MTREEKRRRERQKRLALLTPEMRQALLQTEPQAVDSLPAFEIAFQGPGPSPSDSCKVIKNDQYEEACALASSFGTNVVFIRVEEAEELLGSLMEKFRELKALYENKKTYLRELEKKVEEARQRPAGRAASHAVPSPPRSMRPDNLRDGRPPRTVPAQPRPLRQCSNGAAVSQLHPGSSLQPPISQPPARHSTPLPVPHHTDLHTSRGSPPSTSVPTAAVPGGRTPSPPPDLNRRDVPVASMRMSPDTRTRPSSGPSPHETEGEKAFQNPIAPVLYRHGQMHLLLEEAARVTPTFLADPAKVPPPPDRAPPQSIRPSVSPAPVHQPSESFHSFGPPADNPPTHPEPVSHLTGNGQVLPYLRPGGGGKRAVLARHDYRALGGPAGPSAPVAASPSCFPPSHSAAEDQKQQRNSSAAVQQSGGWRGKKGKLNAAAEFPPFAHPVLDVTGEGNAVGEWGGNTSTEGELNTDARRGADDSDRHEARARAVTHEVSSQPNLPNAPSPPRAEVPQAVVSPSLIVSSNEETQLAQLYSLLNSVGATLNMIPQLTNSAGAVANPPSAPRVPVASSNSHSSVDEQAFQPSQGGGGVPQSSKAPRRS